MNVDEIIRALRCINEAPPTEHNCSECSYGLVKRLPFTLRMKADFWRDYEPYLYGCDYERIQTDAIEALEMLTRRSKPRMTFREKLMQQHPELVSNKFVGGCCLCPCDFGYEKAEISPCLISGKDVCGYDECAACWNREMPEEETPC